MMARSFTENKVEIGCNRWQMIRVEAAGVDGAGAVAIQGRVKPDVLRCLRSSSTMVNHASRARPPAPASRMSRLVMAEDTGFVLFAMFKSAGIY